MPHPTHELSLCRYSVPRGPPLTGVSLVRARGGNLSEPMLRGRQSKGSPWCTILKSTALVESSVSLVYAVVGFVVNPGWIRMVICISYNCVEKLIRLLLV